MAETVRVFLSSPGDVADERGLARKVLNRLRKKQRYRGRVLIEEVSWDDPDNPVTLDAHYTPQEAIDRERPKPSECDVVAVILWSRMGTPLPDEFRKSDGTAYRSGTEWEFLDAIGGARPTVWVYQRTEPVTYVDDDPEFDAKRAQRQAVKAFLGEFRDASGAIRRSVNEYPSPSVFAQRFEDDLGEWLDQRLASLTVTPTPIPPKPPAGADGAAEPIWPGNPYRGLKSFEAAHAPIFFGRGRETDQLLRKVRKGVRVLAVVGAFKLWRQGLELARQRWQAADRERAELLEGRSLQEALLQQRKRPKELTEAQREYVRKSRRRAWRRNAGAAALMLVLPLLAAAYVWLTAGAGLTHSVLYRYALFRLGLSGPPEPAMVNIDCSPEQPCRFLMGEGDDQHEVVITRPYRIGKFEVTFDEFEVFRLAIEEEGGCADGHRLPERRGQDQNWDRGLRPVIEVSWEDARCYAEWLSRHTGKDYSLPSEAQWEYAARAGKPTTYFWGDDDSDAKRYAWFFENSNQRTQPVGLKDPNSFGLYDTAGNVWEWTLDVWHYDLEHAPVDGSAWTEGGESGRRVIRGGSWYDVPESLRSAFRDGDDPGVRVSGLGFRLAQDPK